MKNKVLFLLPLFLVACSKNEESPVITIDKLYINEDQNAGINSPEDYSHKINELPPLKVGDEVDAVLILDGKGAELKSFQFQNCDEMRTELSYEKTDVSTESNLTDEEKGQLRFKDGVLKTRVKVHGTVESFDDNGEVQLSFYLSSKADCEGAQEIIDFIVNN